MNLGEMIPGPDLDCLVANAIGWSREHIPKFSSDFTAAMQAAEEFGLFRCYDNGHNQLLRKSPDGWQVLSPLFFDGIRDVTSMADSGPLAICRAIITFAAKRSGDRT